VHRHAHAAPHGDAVDERHVGLAQHADQVVQAVLGSEEPGSTCSGTELLISNRKSGAVQLVELALTGSPAPLSQPAARAAGMDGRDVKVRRTQPTRATAAPLRSTLRSFRGQAALTAGPRPPFPPAPAAQRP
jgi:hypothetical protein